MELTLDNLLELFLATKKTESRSPKTVEWYGRLLGHFFRFLGEEARIPDLNLNNARAFIASLQDRSTRYTDHPITPEREGGLSLYTIHGYVRAIKAFGAWLVEEGFVTKHPFLNLKRPKLPETVIQVLSEEEARAIISSLSANTFLGARMMLTFSLLYDTVMRASELLNLRIADTDLDNCSVTVWGKGNKQRIIPFGAVTKKLLLRYLTTFRPQCDSPYVLVSTAGEQLTLDALDHMITRLGERSGVTRLHPHLIRHSFAVNYLINGGDVMSLKAMLGHTTVSTTQLYITLRSSISACYNEGTHRWISWEMR